MTIQMEAIEQYFYVAQFIMLYKVVLTLKSVDETQGCDHSNDSYLNLWVKTSWKNEFQLLAAQTQKNFLFETVRYSHF